MESWDLENFQEITAHVGYFFVSLGQCTSNQGRRAPQEISLQVEFGHFLFYRQRGPNQGCGAIKKFLHKSVFFMFMGIAGL